MTRKKLPIHDVDSLAKVLETFNSLDDVRWHFPVNYNLINHCRNDLTADEKLLSHWLCYIVDRQTAFERIWDVGGYVLSDLVHSFTRDGKSPEQTMLAYLRRFPDESSLRLACPLHGKNERLARYDIQNGPVEFASRYMPSDAISIYRTLVILDAVAGRSFARFIHTAVAGEADQSKAVRSMAVALHFLTYADVGQVSADDVFARVGSLASDIKPQCDAVKENSFAFLAARAREFSPYGKKRLWCSIRDYLKSPEFNAYLLDAMSKIDETESQRWHCAEHELRPALAVIELPGDVWNNNRIFRDGLFTPFLGAIPKTWDMPRTVREIHNAMPAGKTTFYPEQLDVTFDFVPRMCAKKNCHVCMFGAGTSRLCHGHAGLYCPVTLAACGYVHSCNPEACSFISDSVKGICREATVTTK